MKNKLNKKKKSVVFTTLYLKMMKNIQNLHGLNKNIFILQEKHAEKRPIFDQQEMTIFAKNPTNTVEKSQSCEMLSVREKFGKPHGRNKYISDG